MKQDTITTAPALLPATTDQHTSLAVSLTRAEVDQQIATAHAYPRSIARVISNITTLATLDEDAAKECIYSITRGDEPIVGPSVRMAEIIGSQWGNCRVGARVVHVDRWEKYVEAEGIFHDLETNWATTARVRRRISDKNGRLFSEDMIIVTGNAALSVAKRNAILGGIPKGIWRKAYEEVESVIAGNVATLSVKREHNVKAFAKFGVTPEQVFIALGVRGMDDLTLKHMPVLVGMFSALKSGEATVEEIFPKERSRQEEQKSITGKLDALASRPMPRTADNEAPPPIPQHDQVTGEITQDNGISVDPVTGEITTLVTAKGTPPDYDRILNDLLFARNKAREGSRRLTAWLSQLDAPAYQRIETHMTELRELAKEADRKGK